MSNNNQIYLEETYEVEKIVNKRKGKKHFEYHVKWKDYPSDDNTWEPEWSLKQDVPDLVKQFNTQFKGIKKEAKNNQEPEQSNYIDNKIEKDKEIENEKDKENEKEKNKEIEKEKNKEIENEKDKENQKKFEIEIEKRDENNKEQEKDKNYQKQNQKQQEKQKQIDQDKEKDNDDLKDKEKQQKQEKQQTKDAYYNKKEKNIDKNEKTKQTIKSKQEIQEKNKQIQEKKQEQLQSLKEIKNEQFDQQKQSIQNKFNQDQNLRMKKMRLKKLQDEQEGKEYFQEKTQKLLINDRLMKKIKQDGQRKIFEHKNTQILQKKSLEEQLNSQIQSNFDKLDIDTSFSFNRKRKIRQNLKDQQDQQLIQKLQKIQSEKTIQNNFFIDEDNFKIQKSSQINNQQDQIQQENNQQLIDLNLKKNITDRYNNINLILNIDKCGDQDTQDHVKERILDEETKQFLQEISISFKQWEKEQNENNLFSPSPNSLSQYDSDHQIININSNNIDKSNNFNTIHLIQEEDQIQSNIIEQEQIFIENQMLFECLK